MYIEKIFLFKCLTILQMHKGYTRSVLNSQYGRIIIKTTNFYYYNSKANFKMYINAVLRKNTIL